MRVPSSIERGLDTVLDKALSIQQPVVIAYLDRIRAKNPGVTPAQLIALLEKQYVRTVIGTGAASGGVAALPGVGTGASIATGVGEVAAFVTATAMFVLAMAEIYDVPTHDPQVRRALVLTVLLGDVGAGAVATGGVEARHWAAALGRNSSKETVRGINSRLGPMLVTRFGARQGTLAVGRALPFGVGAGVGAFGNAALGRGVVKAARRAFGAPPTSTRRPALDR